MPLPPFSITKRNYHRQRRISKETKFRVHIIILSRTQVYTIQHIQRIPDMSKSNDSTSDECAACGMGGGTLKTCTACKLVKYCDRACQQSHCSKHQKACKKRAAELHDEALFALPPPLSRQDCPICFVPLSSDDLFSSYMPCCGKTICQGCVSGNNAEAFEKSIKNCLNVLRTVCPFCRDTRDIPLPASFRPYSIQ